jgi:MATE family multidrug resistance protein
LSRLAAPVALARLGIMGMGVADTIVVGQLAPDQLPALALGWAPTGVLLVTGIGLLMGVQVLTARTIGQERPGDAGAVWRRGLVISLTAGVVCAAGLAVGVEKPAAVFRHRSCAGGIGGRRRAHPGAEPRLHFAYVCCAFFVEAIQRPMPGTGGHLGCQCGQPRAQPAARADARRARIGVGYGRRATVHVRRARRMDLLRVGRAGYGVRERAPHAPSYRALMRVGAAAAVSQARRGGRVLGDDDLAGRIGAEAVAAYQLTLNTLAVVFMISLGVAAATAVLVSEAWGRRMRTRRAGPAGSGSA